MLGYDTQVSPLGARPDRLRHSSAHVLAALAALACGGAPTAGLAAQVAVAAGASLEELAANATPAVVLIDVATAADARQGSGFLVDADGTILTNYHVIRDARSARVKLSSGDIYEEVEILAGDERRDIAVIRIAGYNLPYLQLGDSDSVRVGAAVVLIGSPLGLENTVSTGVVSGRRQEPEGYQLLQISAPASRGSSGGAVLSSRGQVVGIAASQIGGGQNLNFAVPINYARGLITHLGDEPMSVLRPAPANVEDTASRTPAAATRANYVNQGLTFRLSDFRGYSTETYLEMEGNRQRRTRITYRHIETVTAGEPQIERYRESETSRVSEPFGTVQVIRRERSRVVVNASDLRTISARGETADWNGTDWVVSEHDLRFTGDRVVGLVTDSAQRTTEMDRELPRGILLQEIRDLAFALLDAQALVGHSVEFTTFDPRSGRVDQERYDILGPTSIEVAGDRHSALQLNVASGLDNETYVVRDEIPRVLLQRISDDGSEVETITSMEILPRREVR
jgi:hypothetical protein